MRLILLIAALALVAAEARAQNAFHFVAIGDMPYGQRAVTYPKFSALIGVINREAPRFTIHVGDIKSGNTVCSDEEFANQLKFLNSFAAPLIYTPGDNEWTDCHRRNNGAYDPLERLAKLRMMFFASDRSLGVRPMTLERQADVMPEFKTYVENARWMHEGVLFATAHIVGSNNNFEPREPAAAAEFFGRDKANVAWIKSAFEMATAANASALVLAIQANPFVLLSLSGAMHSGFTSSLAETFVPLAERFAKPVLLINGDTHFFRVDHPFVDADGKTVANITRLEVFGASHMHAVRVGVDPAKGQNLWSFQPIYNPIDGHGR